MTLQKILKHAKAAPLLLFAALLLTSCGSDTPAASVKDTDAAISATPVPEPAKETEDSTDSEPAEASSDGSNNDSGKTSGQPESKQPVTVDEIPSSFRLDVPDVLQNPELPTGCESVALTMALMCMKVFLWKRPPLPTNTLFIRKTTISPRDITEILILITEQAAFRRLS